MLLATNNLLIDGVYLMFIGMTVVIGFLSLLVLTLYLIRTLVGFNTDELESSTKMNDNQLVEVSTNTNHTGHTIGVVIGAAMHQHFKSNNP